MAVVIPVSTFYSDILPSDWIEPIEDALDKIGLDIEAANVSWGPNGAVIHHVLHIMEQAKLDFPLVPGAILELEPDDLHPGIEIEITLCENPSIEIKNIGLRLTFPTDFLNAYEKNSDGIYIPMQPTPAGNSNEENDAGESQETNNEGAGFAIGVNFPLLGLDLHGNINADTPIVEIPHAAMIGDTGVILDFGDNPSIEFVFSNIPGTYSELKESEEIEHEGDDEDVEEEPDTSSDDSDELPSDFRGVKIRALTIVYQKEGSSSFPSIQFSNAAIGAGGFSGEISLGDDPDRTLKTDDLDALFDAEGNPVKTESDNGSNNPSNTHPVNLAGMRAVLTYFGIGFKQSVPEWSAIAGYIKLGFIDKWVRLNASIGGPNGDLMLQLGGADGEGLVKIEHEWFDIETESVRYELREGIHYAIIKGSIRPKLGGLNWPKLKVERFSISSKGDIDFDGGWLEMQEAITLDFNGFKLSLSALGLGKEKIGEVEYQWLGVSGSIALSDKMKLSGSVEGLKFKWAPGKDVITEIKGIGVSFEIPKTLSFTGSVLYEKIDKNEGSDTVTGDLFKGSIDLSIFPLKMNVKAELMVGKIQRAGAEFTLFYIFLEANLPAGIPLGATGLSLYGMRGLVGINVAPTKTVGQSWYEWYRNVSPERNVVSVKKWRPAMDEYAFGVGIILGTGMDDGYTFNMSLLLAILIPGPVVIIEGSANLLKERLRPSGSKSAGDSDDEMSGALYTLIVFDGRAGTFQMNVDIEYSLENIIEVGGGFEAFFDFNNAANWYLHIGKKEPESKRIHASVLKILEAQTYFMINPRGLQFGFAAGLDFNREYGPVKAYLVAKISFDAGIFWDPMLLEGRLEMVAALGISVFGIGLGLSISALLEAKAGDIIDGAGKKAGDMWLIYGKAAVSLDLPFPLPDPGFTVEFSWGEKKIFPPIRALVKGLSFQHHLSDKVYEPWVLMNLAGSENEPDPTKGNFPNIVPVDSFPVLTFNRPFYFKIDGRGEYASFFGQPQDEYNEGRFKYYVNGLHLEEWTESNGKWQSVKNGVQYGLPGSYSSDKFAFEFDKPYFYALNYQPNEPVPNEPLVRLWQMYPFDAQSIGPGNRGAFSAAAAAGQYCGVPPRDIWRRADWLQEAPERHYGDHFTWQEVQFYSDFDCKTSDLWWTSDNQTLLECAGMLTIVFKEPCSGIKLALSAYLLPPLKINYRDIPSEESELLRKYLVFFYLTNAFFDSIKILLYRQEVLVGEIRPVKKVLHKTLEIVHSEAFDKIVIAPVFDSVPADANEFIDRLEESFVLSAVSSDKPSNFIFFDNAALNELYVRLYAAMTALKNDNNSAGGAWLLMQLTKYQIHGIEYQYRSESPVSRIGVPAQRRDPVTTPGDSPASVRLMTKPNTKYKLTVETAYEDIANGSGQKSFMPQEFYFQTDRGPGLPIPDLPIPGKISNHEQDRCHDIAYYIRHTLPEAGSNTHYYQHPVAIIFKEPYVRSLLEPFHPRLRFKDRNGKYTDEVAPENDPGPQKPLWAPGLVPLGNLHVLTYLAALSKGFCPGEDYGAPVFSTLPYRLKANRQYSAELWVEDRVIYSFSFVSSRYAGFSDHIRSGVDGNTGLIKVNTLPGVEMDHGKLESLVNDWGVAGAAFEDIWKIIAPSFARSGFETFPKSPAFEIARIPLFGSDDSILLAQSPEPIAWERVRATSNRITQGAFDNESYPLGFIPNADGTMAFLYFKKSGSDKLILRFPAINSNMPPYQIRMEYNGNALSPNNIVLSSDGSVAHESVDLILALPILKRDFSFTAFKHRAMPGNTFSHYTLLDAPNLNGNPEAVIFAVSNWGDETFGLDNPHSFGVEYRGARWRVSNQSPSSRMTDRASFHVLVAPADCEHVFQHQSSSQNTEDNRTYLDHVLVNKRPELHLLVTQNLTGGQTNNHELGAGYDAGRAKWFIYNIVKDDSEISKPEHRIPHGSKFNILALPQGHPYNLGVMEHRVDDYNSLPDKYLNISFLDHQRLNKNPNAMLFFTQIVRKESDIPFNGARVASWYDHPDDLYHNKDEYWSLYTIGFGNNLPRGACFQVFIC